MRSTVNTKPVTIWLLGPTASGKTTLARTLQEKLAASGTPVIHYDGDEVRGFFGDSLGFKNQDRLRVVRTIVHLASKAEAAGLNVVVSALTANQDARELIRHAIPNLLIVYLQCGLKECSLRDPKGIYRRARRGEIDTLIGYNSPYDAPQDYDLKLDTETMKLGECVQTIVDTLQDKCAMRDPHE